MKTRYPRASCPVIASWGFRNQTFLPVAAFCLSLVAILMGCSKPKPMNQFANLRQEYLDALFLAKPHLATFMGDHRFDDRWPDSSPRGVELRLRVLQQQKLRLESVD